MAARKFVTTVRLRLRSAPSTDADIIKVLEVGRVLVERKSLSEIPDGWLAVKANKTEGFVMEKFTELKE